MLPRLSNHNFSTSGARRMMLASGHPLAITITIDNPLTFANLRERYEAARAAELAHDAIAMPWPGYDFISAEAEAENDRLTGIRYDIESLMMSIPSPDASSFAFKYAVARCNGRRTDAYDELLEEEAERFSILPAQTSSIEWQRALADYELKRKEWDRLGEIDSPDCPAACDICMAAQDHLVENVRAPNVEAAIFKMEIAKERWKDFGTPDEWLDAFAADLRHLCAAAGQSAHLVQYKKPAAQEGLGADFQRRPGAIS